VSENLCVACGRPTADGVACQGCAYKAGDRLHTIVDIAPAARDIAHGFAHHGTGGGGGGKPGSKLPFNLTATAKLDGVQNALTGWVRHIAAERGLDVPRPVDLGDDVLVLAAGWLAGHVEWMRHRQEAGDFLADVGAAVRVVTGIARGPASQRYLGPCGAPQWIENLGGEAGCRELEGPPCEGDTYAREGAQHGACRSCGATVSTADRQAWLDGEVRSHAFRATEIGKAYGVNVNTIRSWAARGLLVPHGHDGEERPLFNVGDVLDLAAADAARRATEQAKRARRAADREAAETEEAA
jgi:hypothetical protein